MKNHSTRIILPILFMTFLCSCEKEPEAVPAEDFAYEYATPFTGQADELLSQLPREGLDLLSPADIANFRKGPEILYRSNENDFNSWYPVMGMFHCSLTESATTGEGIWYGYGMSSIVLDQLPDPTDGFGDGHVEMTSEAIAKLTGPFEAKTYHKWSQGKHKQLLKATFEAGTQIFFMPNGKMNMHVLFHPEDAYPITILVEGWVEYGLGVPPVPLAFEDNFEYDALYAHYTGLKTHAGAEPIYIETLNEFWIYPTATPDVVASPGIGTGEWHGTGPITMTVDQTIEGVYAAGRGRFSMGTGPGYKSAEYFEICHTMTLNETGGIWPFDLAGGSEAFFNYAGKGTGVWIGLGEVPFGNVPSDPFLLPADLADDGFLCNSYGNTDCNGFCNPGPGVPTQVYVIAYRYPLSESICISVDIDQVGHPLVPEQTIELPNGLTFTGFGAAPAETTIGSYTGMLQSVIIDESPGPSVIHYRLVHYFSDSMGNSFWTSDFAVATSVDAVTFLIDDKLTVAGGTGDFACARGIFRNDAVMHLDLFTLDYSLTGTICSGCD